VLVGVAAAAALRLPTVQSEVHAEALAPAQLALKLGQWEGVDQAVASDVKEALPSALILSRRYQCPAGAADVTIITGGDATALHDPHDCLTGEGWQFVSEQTRAVQLPRATAGSIRIRDVVMAKGGVRARMWYWYAIGSEIFDRTLTARTALFRTRLARGSRHRAEFVRLIVGGETESERTATLLADLTRQIAGRG
jgi:EpsI family protein